MESDSNPFELNEPANPGQDKRRDVWMRGLWMLLFALFFELAKTVLVVVAIVQFFWMLFSGEKNAQLAGFGRDMGKWLNDVALFQTGASDERPFPWAKWGK